MADLFDPLRPLVDDTPEGPRNRLGADDVRRRGDRRRRMRTTGQALAAGLVVAAAVTATSLLGSGDVTSAPPPTGPATQLPSTTTDSPEPSVSPPTTTTHVGEAYQVSLPPGLDLLAGSHAIKGDPDLTPPGPDVPAFEKVEACGRTWRHDPEPVTRSAFRWSAPEDLILREVTVQTDPEAALRDATALVDLFRSCPEESFDGGASSVRATVVDNTVGDRSWTVQRTYYTGDQPSIGEDVIQVVVVGNVVLLSEQGGEGIGAVRPTFSLKNAVAGAEELQPVITDLCPFSTQDCEVSTGSGSAPPPS